MATDFSKYQRQSIDAYNAAQVQVSKDQNVALARARAREDSARRDEEENQNIFQRAGSFAADMWTDDFSNFIPVIGPAAAAAASTYDSASRGISTIGSSAALAANPEYWANRSEDATLLDDAQRVQPGRAVVALGDALERRLGPTTLLGFNEDAQVYGGDGKFDIANDAERDKKFEESAALKVSSGVVDGLNTFFLDPFVIGGKAVKIARFGTSAPVLGSLGRFGTGFTDRLLASPRKNVNPRVMKSLESEADEALRLVRTGEGSETPIGVIGESIARGEFEDLLELPAFQGSSRDLLASAGAGIKSKEDGIIFLAAAAGVRKYQAQLAERATSLYAGLQRRTQSKYEELLLNTPLGAQRPAILGDVLEKDFNVDQLIRDLAKRDPDLAKELADENQMVRGLLNARDEVIGETGLVERLGGTSVAGMKVAEAWREGRRARTRISQAPTGSTSRMKPTTYRDGTAPAIIEKIYQSSSIVPTTRVWDWVRGQQASGYIDIRGFNVGKASDELKAALSDSTTIRKDKVFVAAQLVIYGAAQGAQARMQAISEIERNVMKRLADEATLKSGGQAITPERLEEIYKIIDKRRAEVIDNFKKRAYGIDPDDGETIIMKPTMRSQLETSMPMLNLRMMEKTIKIAKQEKYADFGAGAFDGLTSQSMKNLVDEVQSIWKAGVLLRAGYTIRNTGEGWLRTAAFLGSVPALGAAPRGFKNSFYNNKRKLASASLGTGKGGIRGRIPITGLRSVARDADIAVDRINALTRQMDELKLEKAKRLDGNPLAMTVDVETEIRKTQSDIEELMGSLAKIEAKKADLQSRRAVGDDGAFGGELNAEHADLLRRLSSADQTTRNFLESAWMRGQDDVLSQSSWGRISPDKPQYWQELSSAVRQFRNDSVAMRVLAGEDTGSIVAWMRSADARLYRRDMKIAKESAEQHVVRLQEMVDNYLPTPEARALAAAGQPDSAQLKAVLGQFAEAKKPPKAPNPDRYDTVEDYYKAKERYDKRLAAFNDSITGVPELRPIHGKEVASTLGGAENIYVKARKQTIDRLFNLLGTYPESTLVRHPFYAEVWKRRFGQLEEVARAQGDELNTEMLEKINRAAHRFAMRSTNETLYTIERYSNPAAAMRWFAPFFPAWENSFTVWTRMIANDPSILARANILWQIPNQLGMVVDENGEPVEGENFSFLNGSQDRFIVLPAAINDFVMKASGGLQIKVAQGSLNVVTPGNTPYLPGFGPTVSYPAGVFLASKPDTQKFLRDWMGDAVYEQFAPFGVPQNSLTDTFMPAWMRKTYEAWRGEDSEDYLRVTSAMWQNAMVEWYKSGGRPEDKPDADVVMARAHQFFKFSAIASLTLPFATTRMSPYQEQVDWWNALKTDPKMTYAEKVDSFITKWGDDYLPLITSSSKTDVPGVDPTIEDYAVLRDNNGLARDLASLSPEAVGILAASAPLGEFDEGVYKWLNENNVGGNEGVLRGPRSVNEMGEAITMQAAWREYRKEKELRDSAMAQMGIKSLDSKSAAGIKQMWNDFVTVKMRAKYGDLWAANYGVFEENTRPYLVGIQTALANEKFMSTTGRSQLWSQVDKYMSERDMALEAIRAGADSASVREMFAERAGEMRYSSLEFADFFDKFLDRDTLQDVGVKA